MVFGRLRLVRLSTADCLPATLSGTWREPTWISTEQRLALPRAPTPNRLTGRLEVTPETHLRSSGVAGCYPNY